MLQIESLSCFRQDRYLFKDLNAKVLPGQALQIVGENGAGKTTLFKILAGLFEEYDGRVIIADAVGSLYLGHRYGVNDQLTPVENLKFLLKLNEIQLAPGLLMDALARFQLSAELDQPCAALSEGQKKRVALARLILTSARIWLLDEAFSALDAPGRAVLSEVCQAHLASGGILIFSSHQGIPEFAAAAQLRLDVGS